MDLRRTVKIENKAQHDDASAERKPAILEIRKIEDYCLSAPHPRGRHKVRVFREALELAAMRPGFAMFW